MMKTDDSRSTHDRIYGQQNRLVELSTVEVKPYSHYRCRRDETVEFRRVDVGGVKWTSIAFNFQIFNRRQSVVNGIEVGR